MKKSNTGFTNTMTKTQRIAGGIYLPVHIVAVPLALSLAALHMPGVFDLMTSNMVYYGLAFIFCLTVMFGYLRRDFDTLLDNFGKVLLAILSSYLIFLVLSYLAVLVLSAIVGEDALTNPNNSAISDITDISGGGPMIAIAVFLAPLAEETLFRGVLFGSIREKSRFWAYAASIALFASYHLWQYAVADFNWTLLLYSIQYIPAGFVMARCYEKTSSIWAAIFLHMINNSIAMLVI